jgi:hypothetical protein
MSFSPKIEMDYIEYTGNDYTSSVTCGDSFPSEGKP